MLRIRKILSQKGQNMAEYAIIFGVVIAAAVGISALIKEGIQDRVVSEVRKIGDDQPLANAAVFDIVSTVTRNRTSTDDTAVALGGAVTESATTNITSISNETYDAGN